VSLEHSNLLSDNICYIGVRNLYVSSQVVVGKVDF
jgi:hypothetical protein